MWFERSCYERDAARGARRPPPPPRKRGLVRGHGGPLLSSPGRLLTALLMRDLHTVKVQPFTVDSSVVSEDTQRCADVGVKPSHDVLSGPRGNPAHRRTVTPGPTPPRSETPGSPCTQFLSLRTSLSGTFQGRGIALSVAFGVCLTIVTSSSIHGSTGVRPLVLFMAEACSPLGWAPMGFLCPSVDGQLGCFCFLAIVNNAMDCAPGIGPPT